MIADDICADFYQLVLRQLPLNLEEKINALMIDQNTQELNALIRKINKRKSYVRMGNKSRNA